jgi:hypothetical protein
MFICAVSETYVWLDRQDMRVVGQDCAYPLWLLRYTTPTCSRAWSRSSKKSRNTKAPAPQFFFVVQDGQWVQRPAAVSG